MNAVLSQVIELLFLLLIGLIPAPCMQLSRKLLLLLLPMLAAASAVFSNLDAMLS